jgi:hypothetical protein
MKKNMFWGLLCLACAGLWLVAAAGCGDGNGGGEDTTTDPSADPDSTADPDTQPDTLPDTPTDTPADLPPDAEPDTSPDTVPDGGDGMDGPHGCSTDEDCTFGEQWCVEGECVPCDNTGEVCDLACTHDWVFYTRNGCTPCACAPANECVVDSDCDSGTAIMKCYAGAFCWDWCPENDPSCCYGNVCSADGCPDPNPAGCLTRGCPEDMVCMEEGCEPSSCYCDGDAWSCTEDCGGGMCQGW